MTDLMKNVLKRALKQAVIGSTTSFAAVKVASAGFNFHTGVGWEHLLIVFFTPIATSEAAYFWPKIMAWAQSPD